MCKNCEERAKKQAADVAGQVADSGEGIVGHRVEFAAPRREIVVSEVENGFLVTFKSEPQMYALLSSGLAGFPKESVHIAANLEAVTEIILTEGRKAR